MLNYVKPVKSIFNHVKLIFKHVKGESHLHFAMGTYIGKYVRLLESFERASRPRPGQHMTSWTDISFTEDLICVKTNAQIVLNKCTTKLWGKHVSFV